MSRRILVVSLLTVAFAAVFAGGLLAQSTKGNDWRQDTERAQIRYIMGFTDAMAVVAYAHDSGETERLVRRWAFIDKCLTERKITVGQTYAVVKKWMNDNPEKWDYYMSIVLLDSLGKLCP